MEWLKDKIANCSRARRVGAWFASKDRYRPKITEYLGFGPKARLLIINADDFGLCPEQNLATIEALETGIVTSTSLMAPGPDFSGACDYALQHDELDVGVHLTLTSEWNGCRWGPLVDWRGVPSLVDGDSYFWKSRAALFSFCDPREAETELRAQIERVLTLGLDISHLDSHMFVLHGSRADLRQVYLKLAAEYFLPIRAARRTLMHWEGFSSLPDEAARLGVLHPDHFAVFSRVRPSNLPVLWTALLRSLPPGLTEVCCHPGYAGGNLAGFANDALQRESDLRFITSPEARQVIEREGIQLVGYRLLRDAMRAARRGHFA
jgi:chitin disaccharide deacetylase